MWKPIIEVLILWGAIYHILRFFEGTRAIQVLRGIVMIFIAFFLFKNLNLEILDWLISKLFGISIIALLIIFHPEIRQGLARLGQRQMFGSNLGEEEVDSVIREITIAAENIVKNKFGALIAIEKFDSLTSYIDSGIVIDSKVSAELIEAVFTPNNPLHDGGLVIKSGKVAAAGCLFPYTQSQDLSRIFGTRHRAALGLSEDTDAIILVVSEERQDISLVYKGKLYKDLSREEIFGKIKVSLMSAKEDA
jgi:diadenylate cyclase